MTRLVATIVTVLIITTLLIGCEKKQEQQKAQASFQPVTVKIDDALRTQQQKVSLILQDLQEFVQKQDGENARSKYLRARFGKFITYSTNIFTEASETKALSVMQEMEKVISEARFIASLTFEGWQPEDEQWPHLPGLPSASNWIDDLEKTGLARPKKLPDLLRSGAISNPDDFYQEPGSTAPGKLIVPSLVFLRAKLPFEAKRRIVEHQFIQEHSIYGLELEVSMLQAYLDGLLEEVAGIPTTYRGAWLKLYESLNKLVEAKRSVLKIMRGSVEIIDGLLEDFQVAAREAYADKALSLEACGTLSAEYNRSMSAIREMREFASGEKVKSFVEKGDIIFISLGQKQFNEFRSAMRKYGVSISRVGVTDFSEISKLPNIRSTGEMTGSNKVQFLGLKSLEVLWRTLRD